MDTFVKPYDSRVAEDKFFYFHHHGSIDNLSDNGKFSESWRRKTHGPKVERVRNIRQSYWQPGRRNK